MRIAFFGLPLAALLLARDGHEVVYAAVCRKGALGTRRLVRLLGTSRVQIVPDATKAETKRRVAEARPDLIVSWFWTKRLPMGLVALAPHGGFGVHPSLLPKYRGPDPFFWAIENGDRETGVTAHRLAEEYDTGALLGKKPLPIVPAWDSWTLARRLDRLSLALLREVAASFARGEPPHEEAQDEAEVTLAPEPDDLLLEIDWNRTTDHVLRRIRAAAPYPGAFTHLGDEEIVITKAYAATSFPRALLPGEATVVEGRALVRAADGAVTLLAARTVDDLLLDASALAQLVAPTRL